MLRRCAWHLRYFGEVLIMGEKEPIDDTRITDGICLRCEAIEMLGLTFARMEREIKKLKDALKEVTSNATIR